MKVVQVTPEFPPPLIGGGGYHTSNLVRELVRKGIDVTVFTLDVRNTFLLKRTKVETQFGKFRVFRVPASYVSRTTYPIAPKLIPLLLKEDADIIHAHGYQSFTSDVASIVSRMKKIPLILTLHGFPRGFNTPAHRIYFNLIGKKTLKATRKMISVSRGVAQEFETIGVPEKKIVIIPNGVNLKEYKHMPKGDRFRKRLNINENEKMVLSIGRLEKIKGFQHLIMALPKIQAKIGPIKLLIAGPEFNYGPQLRRLVKETRATNKVIFYGPVNEQEKLEALAAADIVVIPSIYEGFGIFLLEAMAAGRPIIATRTGFSSEIFRNGKAGVLVSPGDADDIAEKAIALFNNSSLLFSLSLEAKKVVRAFNWEKIASKTTEFYQQCLTRRLR